MKKANFQIILYICTISILFSLSASATADSQAATGQFETPTGLSPVAVGQNSVDISWDALKGATAYYVYRDGTIVNRVTGASYIDTGLKKSSVYRYQIQAIYGTGNSPKSGGKCVRTWQESNEGIDGSVVCPPANLKIVVSN